MMGTQCDDGKIRLDGVTYHGIPFSRYKFDVDQLIRWIDNPMSEIVDSVVSESCDCSEYESDMDIYDNHYCSHGKRFDPVEMFEYAANREKIYSMILIDANLEDTFSYRRAVEAGLKYAKLKICPRCLTLFKPSCSGQDYCGCAGPGGTTSSR